MIFTVKRFLLRGEGKMKFYMASGFQNKELVQKVAQDIEIQLGWERTYDWTQNIRAQTIVALTDIGIKEYEGVLNADVVIVILPGGKGCHTEMGIAIGSQKHLLLYDPDRTLDNLDNVTTFYFLPQIRRWNGDINELYTMGLEPSNYSARL